MATKIRTATKAEKHLAYLKKQLKNGIRYVKGGAEDFTFRLYSPTGERVFEWRYIDYEYEHAYELFYEKVEKQFLGHFDYSDIEGV